VTGERQSGITKFGAGSAENTKFGEDRERRSIED